MNENEKWWNSCKTCKHYNNGTGEVICDACDIICNDLWESATEDDGK